MNESFETTDQLNERYADALLPVTITFGFFALVGVVGNAFVLVVFSLGREYRKSNFRVFVICLAIIDFLTSIFLIPAEMVKHRNFFAFESLFMCKAKCVFNVWAAAAAALSLLIICVDRFIKVVLPLKKQISPQLAVRLCVLLSFVVPVVLSVPGGVMCGVLTSNKTNVYNTSTQVNLCATEPKYQKHILRYIYKFTFIILLVGISVVSLVMYILIGRQIFKHWGSMPVSFRKDSGKDMNSDISSDTFGHIHIGGKKLERSTSSASDSQSQVSSPTSPTIKKEPDGEQRKRPPLVHQGSSFDMDPKKAKKKLIKQISSSSFSSSSKRKGSSESSPRRRTMSRQQSGFGMRQFPYKTLIWFILTLVFIVTYMLYLVLAVYVARSYNKEADSFALFNFFYRFYFVNNIINPIVYALLDRKFRKASRKIGPTIKARLCCCFS